MQVAREIQVAHEDMTRPANFDALLDHFYQVGETIIDLDPQVYCGVDYDKKPIYKLIALIQADQRL